MDLNCLPFILSSNCYSIFGCFCFFLFLFFCFFFSFCSLSYFALRNFAIQKNCQKKQKKWQKAKVLHILHTLHTHTHAHIYIKHAKTIENFPLKIYYFYWSFVNMQINIVLCAFFLFACFCVYYVGLYSLKETNTKKYPKIFSFKTKYVKI